MNYMEQRRNEFYRELAPKAVPGSPTWHRLENLGFTGDYTEADHGEAPQGAN